MTTHFDNSLFGNHHRVLNEATLRIQAGKSFNSAYNRGRLWQFLAKILRKDNHLQSISRQPVFSHRRTGGTISVPIRQIKGSLGRNRDFDAHFNPLDESSRSRWISVLTAIHMGVAMPAVDLIQVGDIYYVVDGHHRISVFKSLGQQMIDARIVN